MKTLRTWQRLAVAFCLVFGLATAAYAVNTNARIRGTVTDASGAVLPNVHVTATNIQTGVKYDATSGADGTYYFAQLPVGTYAVSASAPSFKSFSASGIVLNIDQEYVENISMTVGSNAETVQVNASGVQVDTTDMQLSNVVNSEQMVEYPIINRNFTGLELSLPGVQASSDRFGTYSVSGAQTQQSEFLINGADTNDISLNTLAVAPNLDAIDQFNLIEGPLNAEYDRNSGGIVSATIKQGTNHIHGDAFEFYRDTFLNTANFYQHNAKTGKPVVSTFHQNIPGATVGGPILRDKIFFFFGYQGTRQVTPQTGGNPGVLSNAERNGDFSADAGKLSTKKIPGTIVIPGCTPGETWAACGAAIGYQFPVSSFNPISATLIKNYVPTPNAGTYSYLFKPVTQSKINQYIGRLDLALNPRNQIYGVVINQKNTTTDTLPFTGATVPGFGDQSTTSVNQFTADYVHSFSSTLVNDLAAHYTRFNFDAVEPQKSVAPSSVGFSINPENTKGQGLPRVNISGLNGVSFNLGFSSNGPQPRIDQAIQLDDSVSKVLGKHVLKFGYEGERFNVSNPFSASNNGQYSFRRTSSAYTTGDGALDFVLGVPAIYTQGSGAKIQADAFLNYVYGQDQWKMSNSFTLNYGLAYSIDTPLRNHQYGGEAIACFVSGFNSTLFAGAPQGIAYPGEAGCKNSGQAVTRYNEFGPRVGFAWAPSSGWLSGGDARKFAIRGGFGIYYNRSEEESSLQTLETPPFGLTSNGAIDYGANAPQFGNPYVDLNSGASNPNKFPYAFPTKGQTISDVTWASLEPFDISTYGPSFRAPYSENFQLGVERQLPSQIVARISYVGSLARRNQATYESDYETAAGHAACLADPVCVADQDNQVIDYPEHTIGNSPINPLTGVSGIGSVGTVGSFASSSYNSVQVLVQKAPTHGLTFQVAYTYAHALDSGSSFEDSGFGGSVRGWNQYVKWLNYGDSQYDVRNRLVVSPLYIVPKFSGPAYNIKNIAFAGWEISGIITLAQGFPYDISYGGASSAALWCSANWYFYACPDIPNQLSQITTGNLRTRQAGTGFSTLITNADTAFTDETTGSFGNIHRNPYHGPGINNTNMILAKNFYLSTERNIWLQLRMESDNVFNHTSFNNPDGNFVDSTFGQVTSAASGRQSQLAVKVYF